MKRIKTVLSASAADTYALAQHLGCCIEPGTVIAADGELGAGKTVFAAGLAAGLGITEPVVSPTFIVFNEYAGRLTFCHIDAYRMDGLEQEEIALCGLEDCFSSNKVVLAEWPRFIADWLPPETIWIDIKRTNDDERCLTFTYDDESARWLHEALGD